MKCAFAVGVQAMCRTWASGLFATGSLELCGVTATTIDSFAMLESCHQMLRAVVHAVKQGIL